jgi:quinol monooxygenase YgiN
MSNLSLLSVITLLLFLSSQTAQYPAAKDQHPHVTDAHSRGIPENDRAKQESKTVVHGIILAECNPEDHTAMRDELQRTIAPSREEAGNVYYHLYEHATKPGHFLYAEAYKDMEALTSHIKTNPVVDEVFRKKPYAKHLLTKLQLEGPFIEVPAGYQSDEYEMVFQWENDCPRDRLWEKVGNFNSSGWLYAGPQAKYLAPNIKQYIFDDGTVFTITQEDQGDYWFYQSATGLKFSTYRANVSLVVSPTDPTKTMVHYRAWVRPMEGQTIEQARDYLKDDFFTHRIPYYAPSFGCRTPAEKAATSLKSLLSDLYKAIEAKDVESALKVFSSDAQVSDPKTGKFSHTPKEYLTQLLRESDGNPASSVRIVNPIPPYIVGSVAAVVEDYLFSNIKTSSSLHTQLVLYNIHEDKINKVEVFQKDVVNSGLFNTGLFEHVDSNLKKYYAAVNSRSKTELQNLYASQYVIHDPVGAEPKSIDAAYGPAFAATKFHLTPTRVYSSYSARAVLVFGEFAANGKEFNVSPIQVFHFDRYSKIVSFDAYFVARSR